MGVAVFYDDGAGERNSPLLAGGMQHASGTGDDDGVFGDDERLYLVAHASGRSLNGRGFYIPPGGTPPLLRI